MRRGVPACGGAYSKTERKRAADAGGGKNKSEKDRDCGRSGREGTVEKTLGGDGFADLDL